MGRAVLVFFLFIVILFLGMPIVFSMGVLTITTFVGDPTYLMAIYQKLCSALDNFTYLSIPMFILAGELMSECGLTYALVRFCNAFIGHIRGGLALVNVLASMLFAGVSGSASADTSGLGKVEIDMMTKAGYDRNYSTTVTVASAIIGPIIPPSNIFIIYAAAAGSVSIAAMFFAGIIPGVLLGLVYMCLCYYYARKNNHPVSPKATWKEKLDETVRALPVLVLPVIILGGILLGVFTAVESAAVAVIYAIIVSAILKKLTIKSLYGALKRAAKMAANIMLIIAVANLMGYAITVMQVPQMISQWFSANVQNGTVFLIVLNIVLIVLGTLLDQAPALLLTVPVLFPIAVSYGIDPIHFGLVTCLSLTIGLVTPPVGMQLFIGANVGKVKLSELYKSIIPFVAVAFIAQLLVTFIPQLSTWIPTLLGY